MNPADAGLTSVINRRADDVDVDDDDDDDGGGVNDIITKSLIIIITKGPVDE